MPEYSIQYGGKTYTINPPNELSPAEVQQAFGQITQHLQGQQDTSKALGDPNVPVEQKRGMFGQILSKLAQPLVTTGREMLEGGKQVISGGPLEKITGAGRMAFAPATAVGEAVGEAAGASLPQPSEQTAKAFPWTKQVSDVAQQVIPPTAAGVAAMATPGGASLPGMATKIPGMIGAAERYIAPRLPEAGEVLRNFGIGEARKLAPSLVPEIPSKVLFEDLAKENPLIPLDPIKQQASAMLKSKSMLAGKPSMNVPGEDVSTLEASLAKAKDELKLNINKRAKFQTDEKLNSTISDLQERIANATNRGGSAGAQSAADPFAASRGIAQRIELFKGAYPNYDKADFQTVHATMEDLNALIDSAKGNSGADFGKLMQLKKGFWQALEKASLGTKGSQYEKLKLANDTFRREIAAQTVDDIVFKNFGQPLEGTGSWSSSAAQAQRQLMKATRDDPFLKASFPEGELDRVLETFDKLRQLPVRPPPRGAAAGSMRVLTKTAIAGSLGVLGGAATGVHPAIGGAAAELGMFAGQRIIADAIKRPGGSELLLKMLNAPGGMDMSKMAALQTFTRGAASYSAVDAFNERAKAQAHAKESQGNEGSLDAVIR